MTAVYKGDKNDWRTFSVVDRRGLEDFPEEERLSYDFLPQQAAPVPEEAPELDPEAIRAAVFEEAREEAERLVQEAYQEGYRRGEEAGLAAFEESVAGALEMLQQVGADLTSSQADFLASLEPDVVRLSMLIAERVLQRELSMHQEIVRDAARRCLEQLSERTSICIRVHPDDLSAIRNYQHTLQELFADITDLQLVGDEAVSRGGCLVETASSQVDGRLETLFSEVVKALEL